MGKIKVLPANIANKIAAGEVVDRPASVVKELVENAIDAGADQVTVIIAQAGKELIQVIDNGAGMDEGDAELAFERHATSKIKDVNDLDNIDTLGFRGEALPSIASVSRMELKTCLEGSPLGISLQIDGGVFSDKTPLALKRGTIVTVKNLFFNTPARRNFLRADTTEFNHILKWMKRFFLAYPEVQFSLVHNGEELFQLPRTDQRGRISQVFGKAFAAGLLPVREQLGEMILEGFLSKPDKSRGNRENQFLYLNRRAITNHTLSHAIQQGYGNLLERSRYPQFIMFLDMTPEMVDVNVHPTKMEVRFANERAIYHMFLGASRRVVQSGDAARGFSFSTKDGVRGGIRPTVDDIPDDTRTNRPVNRPENFPPTLQQTMPPAAPPSTPPIPSEGTFTLTPEPPGQLSSQNQISIEYQSLPKQTDAKQPPLQQSADQSTGELRPARLWQVHQRYIFSQIKSGLVIIDQQAAHERILYEQLLAYREAQKSIPSQQLLFPQTLELLLEDYLLYQDLQSSLQEIGFRFNNLSGRTVVIEAIPVEVKPGKEARILIDILDFYRQSRDVKLAPFEKIAAAFANKNAIRSGEILSAAEMDSLVNRLFATREPHFCPHGRPVIVTLELSDIDRRFKRS